MKEILPVHLKNYVQHYASKDGVLSQHLATGKHVMVISCTLRVPRSGLELVISLDRDPRVEALGDLVEERCPPEINIVAADITLSLEVRSPRSTNLANDPAEQLHTISYLEPADDQLEWFRIGDVMVPLEDGKTFTKRRAGREWECVGYTNPLLASRNLRTGKVQFCRMHAYDFIDFVVGDLEDRRLRREIFYGVELLGPFSHPRLDDVFGGDLSKIFTEYVEEREPGDTLGSGLPFLPTLCYNVFRAEDFGLGIGTWPKHGVDVAVRCVSQCATGRRKPPLQFPRDIRLTIREEDGLEGLCNDVLECIDVEGLQDGVLVTSNKLFDPEHESWTVELWVMPQGQRKLFRYIQGKLDQFLDGSDKTRVLDKRLYCEAHIIPKGWTKPEP